MSVNVHFQHIKSAVHKTLRAGNSDAFDAVDIQDESGGCVTLFLRADTGRAVADAINAAIAPAVAEAAE